jgi:two-component system KDP operon response regulator KdpE
LIQKKVLVIDDEPMMCRLVSSIFSDQGATVVTANSGQEGIVMFQEVQPDLVILDILMPNLNGWEVCHRIRNYSDVPIIMLTVLNRSEEIVRAFDAGADDYVVKPFDREVLLARARALLRRSKVNHSLVFDPSFDDGYLAIDVKGELVMVDGQLIRLTSTEFDVLSYLYENSGQVCTFAQILENVWGEKNRYKAEYVHVYIWRLRQKLEVNPRNPVYLLSEHSLGYRFINGAITH